MLPQQLTNRDNQQCEMKTEVSHGGVPFLPEDCVSNIIIRLPLESLQASRFVCKMWYKIINSPSFIYTHLLRHADIGIIALKPVTYGHTEKTFSVESKVSELLSLPAYHYPIFNPPPLYGIQFLEIKDGKSEFKDYKTTCMGNIRATCHGLIILENRLGKGGLIILNPVTREMKPVPLGTRSSPHHESYGLAFNPNCRVYKLVHLFQDELRYIGCEIIEIGNGNTKWKAVDGPPFGLFGWLGYQPVFAIGALHWLPNVDHNEQMVSMSVDDEKFVKTRLPKIGGILDRVFEMSGFLGFVSRDESRSNIDVWMLRDLAGEVWEKMYCISVDSRLDMVPLCCVGFSGEIVFMSKGNDLYAYNCCSGLIREIEMNEEYLPSVNRCFPHINSIISWQTKSKE